VRSWTQSRGWSEQALGSCWSTAPALYEPADPFRDRDWCLATSPLPPTRSCRRLLESRLSRGISSFEAPTTPFTLTGGSPGILVDGARLTEFMMEHAGGVSHRKLKVPKLDGDYFENEPRPISRGTGGIPGRKVV